MKEFWIYKNGDKYIDYAEDISDLCYRDAIIIEANQNNTFDNDHIQIHKLGEEESEFYENYYEKHLASYYEDDYEEEYINNISQKIEKIFNISSKLNKWEQNFVYGLKRTYNNKNKISDKQMLLLDNLLVKYV